MDEGRRGKWMVFVLGSIYLVGELGHYLIGVVSRQVAQDLHYGSKACFPRPDTPNHTHSSFLLCNNANTSLICESINKTEESGAIDGACIWDYSGLGMDYQILAGPSFMGVFTVAGVLWGLAADKFNRIYLLFAATIMFSSALACTALATSFWHLVLFRILLGIGVSGCSPLAAGMICDVFPQKQRGKAMSVYNCGMYLGYGLSYAVGIYLTAADIFGQSWRATFVLAGAPGVILAFILLLTVKNPEERPVLIESEKGTKEASYSAYEAVSSVSLSPSYNDLDSLVLNQEAVSFSSQGSHTESEWKKCFRPVIIFLILAACFRRSAGYTLRYNSALYFQTYYPTYDVGWWLTGIYCIGGIGGSILGGVTSDRLVNRLGVVGRAVVLAVGQLLATPFAFGLLYLDPPIAFIPQSIGYLFGAMWFGAMFTILVELVPPTIRSSAFGVAFFIMENVGGNLPVIVEYLSSFVGYRTALAVMYPGELFTSAVLFLIVCILLRR